MSLGVSRDRWCVSLTRAADEAEHCSCRVPRHDLGARGGLTCIGQIGPCWCEVRGCSTDNESSDEQLVDVRGERVPHTAAEHEHETAEEYPLQAGE